MMTVRKMLLVFLLLVIGEALKGPLTPAPRNQGKGACWVTLWRVSSYSRAGLSRE
jgi:hypothetical protein